MEQADLLRYVLEVMKAQGINYALVGSLASGVFGEGRLTLDIDILVDLTNAQVESLCGAFPAPEYYVSVSAARDAVRQCRQFNVIHPSSGNKIDFMIARQDEWGREQLARRRQEWIFPDLAGYLACPEDVILGKMLYYQEGQHEKHLRDIAAMIRISGEHIDLDDVTRWAEKLGLTDIWQAILTRVRSA